jgi:hypothetical protein
MWHPLYAKSWQSLRRQAAVARFVHFAHGLRPRSLVIIIIIISSSSSSSSSSSTTVLWSSWAEFQATDPEVRVRFPVLPNFLRSIGFGTGPTQPRKYN